MPLVSMVLEKVNPIVMDHLGQQMSNSRLAQDDSGLELLPPIKIGRMESAPGRHRWCTPRVVEPEWAYRRWSRGNPRLARRGPSAACCIEATRRGEGRSDVVRGQRGRSEGQVCVGWA